MNHYLTPWMKLGKSSIWATFPEWYFNGKNPYRNSINAPRAIIRRQRPIHRCFCQPNMIVLNVIRTQENNEGTAFGWCNFAYEITIPSKCAVFPPVDTALCNANSRIQPSWNYYRIIITGYYQIDDRCVR